MQHTMVQGHRPTGKHRVHILLDHKLYEQLHRTASRERRTHTAIIEIALERYLDEKEGG